MNESTARERIEERLAEGVSSNPDLHNVHLLIHSPSRDLHWDMAFTSPDAGEADPNRPFHAASVGKTFTATLIAMLVEDGHIEFSDPIEPYLDTEVFDGLHVYKGHDFSEDICIDHLLSHTSGLPHLLADEFGLLRREPEQGPDGRTFLDIVLDDPTRFWEPEETVDWAKANLEPHFQPGAGRFYSEVGYNLLGLIIEEVTGDAYHQVLHDRLFDPLGMDHSYLSQYSTPAVESEVPVAHIYMDDQAFNPETYRSFSAWYAGGQTVNTAADLLAFHRALAQGELVDPDTLSQMQQWGKLTVGLDYGYGLIRFRPLPMMKRYHLWGGLGATSSFMMYNPANDVYLAGTFNQWNYNSKAMRFLFKVVRTVSKVNEPVLAR